MRIFVLFTISLILLSFISCKKKETPSAEPLPYATFSIKGVKHIYNSSSKFSKNSCTSSAYCGEFYYDSDLQETNLIKFSFPDPPSTAHLYQSGDAGFEVYYLNDLGVRYDMTNSSVQVMLSVWEGQGGWAKATFSGWLRSGAHDSLEIINGYFQGRIETTAK